MALTGGQWNENGIPVVFEYDIEENNLTMRVSSEVDYYDEEALAGLQELINETEAYCRKFGVKKVYSTEEANRYVKRETDDNYATFDEDEEGNVYGSLD